MCIITDFKRSYEAHFNEPAPQVWQRPHKGYTIAYPDGRRVNMYKRLATLVLGYKKEAGFAAWRFRPVVERKTDISIFQAMLNTTKEPANA